MGAVRSVDRDGDFHPSKLEAAVYDHYLWPQLKGGIFSEIKKYPSVNLGWNVVMDNYGNKIHETRIKWKVDYAAKFKGSDEWVYYEPKGVETSDYKRKLRIWKKCGPGVLYVVKGQCYNGNWKFRIEEYIP